MKTITDKKEKAIFFKQVAERTQLKDVKYYVDSKDIILSKDNGEYFAISKPHIKTSFCFGYGFCGISTEEDHQQASEQARLATQSANRFMFENLQPINEWIESLSEYITQIEKTGDAFTRFYKITSNYNGESQICGVDYERREIYENNGYKILPLEDAKEILNAYQLELERLTKRLNTYLKRYGLSKIKTWSYLSD